MLAITALQDLQIADLTKLEVSEDYRERFAGEYLTLRVRYEKLYNMVDKWDKGELPFKPTCPRDIYTAQLEWMEKYINLLEQRAEIENVDLLQYAYLSLK